LNFSHTSELLQTLALRSQVMQAVVILCYKIRLVTFISYQIYNAIPPCPNLLFIGLGAMFY